MLFSDELLGRIDDNHFRKLHESKYSFGLGINVMNLSTGAEVMRVNTALCKIDELTQLIDELTDMKRTIEKETGLIL